MAKQHSWAVFLFLIPSAVWADAKMEIQRFASSVTDATKNGQLGNNNFFDEPAVCEKAVKDGATEGLKPTDTFLDGEDNTVLWKRAPEVCVQYAKLHRLAKVVAANLHSWQEVDAYSGLRQPDGTFSASVSGDAFRGTVDEAKVCVKRLDEAIAKGVPADIKFAPQSRTTDERVTLVEARKRCSDWITAGAAAAKADDDRGAADVAALKAKYSKFGITGDRLTYLVKYGHQPVFGRGCAELSGKALKTAPAFYQPGQDDLAWIVYKTAFKGDKQVSYTSKRYRKDGSWYCK